MVIHDEGQREALAVQKEKQPKVMRVPSPRWSVLVVQSLACAVLILLGFLFRLAGGDSYDRLRQGFHKALQRNELVTVLVRLWDGEVEMSDDDVKQSDFTQGNPLEAEGSSLSDSVAEDDV